MGGGDDKGEVETARPMSGIWWASFGDGMVITSLFIGASMSLLLNGRDECELLEHEPSTRCSAESPFVTRFPIRYVISAFYTGILCFIRDFYDTRFLYVINDFIVLYAEFQKLYTISVLYATSAFYIDFSMSYATSALHI